MALSPDEKFIYVNPDTTTGEYNTSRYFPVKYLRGLEAIGNDQSFTAYFENPYSGISTRLIVSVTAGFIKDFFIQFVDEINFGENAVITLADRNVSTANGTGGTDFQHVNAFVVPAITNHSDSTVYIQGNLTMLNPSTTPSTITGDLTGDVTGNADTATALATARAINGVDFDGSAAITVPAAGSTLSDTVPVGKGGTGATSLTTDGVLFGNGTSAVSAVDLSSSGNIVVGGSTPAAVTGANLAGSGLAATVGNGTLVLAVETLNQDTTGSAATLTTPRAINGVDFDGSAPITVTAAGSTLSDTVTVAKGGTGLATVGTNNILTGNGTGALTSEANLRYDDSTLRLFSTGSGKPEIILSSTHTTKDAQPVLTFLKNSTGEDGENIGSIEFIGTNDDDGTVIHAQILGEISDASEGDDGGKLTLNVASDSGNLAAGLVIEDGDAGGEVDATIGAGAASVTTVAGTLTMGSTAALTNAGLVAVANQSNITSVGTLTALTVDTLNLNGNTISSTADGDVFMVLTNNGISFEANSGDKFLFNVSNANNVDFQVSGENDPNVFYIDASADKVGIGTSTPAAKLDVVGDISSSGVATVASLTCTAAGTFGGGYGATGATISTAGVGQFNGALTTDASLTCTGTVLTNAQGATTGGRILIREGTDNGTNYVGFTVPAAITTNTIFILPDGDGSANQVLKTDGGSALSWTDMSGGTVGWHGSGTRIKILHRDFIPDDGGRPAMIDDTGVGSEELFLKSHSSNPLYATVAIPTGFKATHAMVYGTGAGAMEVWEHQINSKTGVSKGTGNVGTEIDITDVTSSTTNYLFIRVASASGTEVHGGYVTIATA